MDVDWHENKSIKWRQDLWNYRPGECDPRSHSSVSHPRTGSFWAWFVWRLVSVSSLQSCGTEKPAEFLWVASCSPQCRPYVLGESEALTTLNSLMPTRGNKMNCICRNEACEVLFFLFHFPSNLEWEAQIRVPSLIFFLEVIECVGHVDSVGFLIKPCKIVLHTTWKEFRQTLDVFKLQSLTS